MKKAQKKRKKKGEKKQFWGMIHPNKNPRGGEWFFWRKNQKRLSAEGDFFPK